MSTDAWPFVSDDGGDDTPEVSAPSPPSAPVGPRPAAPAPPPGDEAAVRARIAEVRAQLDTVPGYRRQEKLDQLVGLYRQLPGGAEPVLTFGADTGQEDVDVAAGPRPAPPQGQTWSDRTLGEVHATARDFGVRPSVVTEGLARVARAFGEPRPTQEDAERTGRERWGLSYDSKIASAQRVLAVLPEPAAEVLEELGNNIELVAWLASVGEQINAGAMTSARLARILKPYRAQLGADNAVLFEIP